LSGPHPSLDPLQNLAYLQNTTLEVDVSPREAERPRCAQAKKEARREQRGEPVPVNWGWGALRRVGCQISRIRVAP
jgi:hypothetical protein